MTDVVRLVEIVTGLNLHLMCEMVDFPANGAKLRSLKEKLRELQIGRIRKGVDNLPGLGR